MKIRIFGLIIAALALALAMPGFAAPVVGEKAPEIETTAQWNNNGRTKLSDFVGEHVLLVFWATW